MASFRINYFDAADLRRCTGADGQQACDGGVEAEIDARFSSLVSQSRRELVHVAGFVGRGEIAADNPVAALR